MPALRFYDLCDDYMLCLVLSLTCAVTQALYYLLLCEQTPFSHTYLDAKITSLHSSANCALREYDMKAFTVGMDRASQLDPGSLEPSDESLRYCIERERLETPIGTDTSPLSPRRVPETDMSIGLGEERKEEGQNYDRHVEEEEEVQEMIYGS